MSSEGSPEVKNVWWKQGGKGPGQSQPQSTEKDPLDEIIERNKRNLASEARTAEVEEIIARSKERKAESERRIKQLNGTQESEAEKITVSAATTATIIGALVNAGYDSEKANAFIKGLDQETLARLTMLSGQNRGVDALMPLFLYGQQKGTSATELAAITKPYVDLVEKQLDKSTGGVGQLTDFAEAVNILRPQKDENNELMGAILSRMEKSDEKFNQLVEMMHQRDLNHQKEMSDMRLDQARGETETLRREIGGLSEKLENANKVDVAGEIKKSRDMLEGLGLKVGPGKESTMDDASKLVETVLKTPAIENLTKGLGQGLANGMNNGPRAPRTANGFLCQMCLAKGVRTQLQIPIEVLQGKGTYTCQACGAIYGKPGPGTQSGVTGAPAGTA